MGAWHKDDSMIKHESNPRVYIHATEGMTWQTLNVRLPPEVIPGWN